MLAKLIDDVMKDGKMSDNELLDIMCEHMDEEEKRELYEEIYVKAYGHKLNDKSAQDWVRCMAVTDGSGAATGEHWTESETYSVGNSIGIDWCKCSRWDWYAVMNMMYSDYYKTAQATGNEDSVNFFAMLARDFIQDKDGGSDKVFRYYMMIF